MKVYVHIFALLVCGMLHFGCASPHQQRVAVTPKPPKAVLDGVLPSRGTESVFIGGFVKAGGIFAFHSGMTVGDALQIAGGYGECHSCRAYAEEHGTHPNFEIAPRLRRNGYKLKLPTRNSEWTKFPLEPNDELEFHHILW